MEESWLLLLPDVLDDLLVDVGLLPSELGPELVIYPVILSCGVFEILDLHLNLR